jgi:hypothetical protein
VTAGNKFADRDAYFGKFDYTFWGSSIGLKILHEDFRYIEAGKNSVGADFNTFFRIGATSGLYLSIGGFYRVINYRWNKNSWSPASFDGEDRQSNWQGCFGFYKAGLIGSSLTTLDINTKDSFSYYNMDNIAVDLGMHWGDAKSMLKLAGGVRLSGVSGAVPDISDYHATIGLVFTR